MKCTACSHENRDGAKFCEECATPFVRLCAGCGAELRPTAKFCDECGAPTAASTAQPKRQTEAAGARKVVTVVFADLVGSTALHERVDAESARRLMERYYDVLRAAVEEHGGTVVKLLGDGVMAAFGVPQVAEDDALRAVRAGMAMQDAFRVLLSEQAASLGEVGLRVAVNTGEVVVSGANDDVVGDPVNVAARLQQEARDGDVVIGEATQRLVSTLVTLESLGSFALKGRAESVKAYRVVSLERPAGASATPFVGREDELARISRVYDAAVAAPAARLAVLLGSPGLGKSRLIDELARRQSETATVISAHCDSTGGATFAPLARALRRALHIDDGANGDALRAAVDADTPGSEPDRARIVDGITTLLAGSPASPEETFFVVRRLLAALAKERPVVLVIDDIHWAEPLLLDLVEHLIQWGSGVPLLVLVGARPELRDSRSSLATPGGLVADVVTLSGLDAGAAMRLAANVIGAADLPAAVAAKVLATSEGNPLFVGELIRMLVQEGALERHGDRWTIGAGLAELEMPPTIHALLAARIERLRPDERLVLERAAVVGRQFSRSAVAELLQGDVTDLDARLEALRRSELIERDTGWFLGEPVLRFHHVLIRDAAYRRVLKGTRAELHARFADWIEARVGESVEHEEIIGWHLEQAHLYLGELGPVDAKGRVLGERAARYLAAAGRRALARDDLPLAASLLGRALARLDADDPSRADLALDWCEALLATGDVGPAAEAINELGRFIADSERLRAWHTCFAGQLTVFTEPQALHETADAVAAAADTLTARGDSAGEAKAHFVHAQALARLGKIGACEAALDRALAAARRAGDRRRANAVLAGAPLAALWGPSPVTRASGRCLDVVRVLRITQGAPAVEAVALSCQGVLEALRGRTDAARRMIASSRKMVEELGITHRLLEADVFAGQIDLLEGDAATAERSLRGAYDGLRDLGLGIDAAQAAALLARALLAQGRAAEAEALSHESETLAGDDLKAAIAWRCVRAEALARRGEYTQAVELAEAAVAIASATDALLDHADARLALAAALRAAGRGGDANAEERRATELWEAKGATLLAERARHGVARVEAPTPAREARVEPAGPARRRVRPNAANVWVARVEAAIRGRDHGVLDALLTEHHETVDHSTGTTYGRDGAIASIERMMRLPDFDFRYEVLATLGESLGLVRRVLASRGTTTDEFDVAEYEVERIGVYEFDEAGRLARAEVFATDRLSDAITRLYELRAKQLPEGPSRQRAAGIARSISKMYRNFVDPKHLADPFAADVEMVDHRRVGLGTLHGAESVLDAVRVFLELVQNAAWRADDVLALTDNAGVQRSTNSGTDRVSGGPFERVILSLLLHDDEGRVCRWETFESEDEAEALARFDELTGATDTAPVAQQSAPRFANAATRLNEGFIRAWAARDWDAFMALHIPKCELDDRRRLMRVEESTISSLPTLRMLFDVPGGRWTITPIATRGERLALSYVLFEGQFVEGGGDLAIDYLCVDEVDADGLSTAVVLFDLDDLDAAYAELDARYDAGEARAHPLATTTMADLRRAWAARDWNGLIAACGPDFHLRDHRLLGWGTTVGDPVEWARTQQALVDLAPDVRIRADHVRLAARGWLRHAVSVGTREGGAFELPAVMVTELDERGKLAGHDLYDPEQLEQAFARFEEIRAAVVAEPEPRFANAASRALDRTVRCFNARDWEGMVATYAPDHRMDDRRKLIRIEVAGEGFFANEKLLFDVPGSAWHAELLATRGERLALCRVKFTAGGEDTGPMAVDVLDLVEVDAHGRRTTLVVFDPDDLDSAHAELDARFAELCASADADPGIASQHPKT